MLYQQICLMIYTQHCSHCLSALDVVDSGAAVTTAAATTAAVPKQPAMASWSIEKVAEWLEEQQLQE